MKVPNIKEIVTHNQVQILSQMYMLIGSSLSDTVLPGVDGPIVVPCPLPAAAKAAAEVALIDIANRLGSIAADSSRWSTDAPAEEAMSVGVEEKAKEIENAIIKELFGDLPIPGAPKKKSNRKKKGGGNEQVD